MAMILGTAVAFQCGTIGALNNLVNGIIGTAKCRGQDVEHGW